jgi:hypothetical protein
VGLYAGYNYFALVHHLQHHRGKDLAGVAYLRRLERLHVLHHHRQVVNFGISTRYGSACWACSSRRMNQRRTTSSGARSDRIG